MVQIFIDSVESKKIFSLLILCSGHWKINNLLSQYRISNRISEQCVHQSITDTIQETDETVNRKLLRWQDVVLSFLIRRQAHKFWKECGRRFNFVNKEAAFAKCGRISWKKTEKIGSKMQTTVVSRWSRWVTKLLLFDNMECTRNRGNSAQRTVRE